MMQERSFWSGPLSFAPKEPIAAVDSDPGAHVQTFVANPVVVHQFIPSLHADTAVAKRPIHGRHSGVMRDLLRAWNGHGRHGAVDKAGSWERKMWWRRAGEQEEAKPVFHLQTRTPAIRESAGTSCIMWYY